ncbi:acyl-CoA dehydrogenase family protein [Actinomadura bangladeshensis]|uniref:Acyl-CoA dehydrogenase n=1 Tax=Actinomadura bangladeshensis TaxID=453573 RepID=A0A4R4PF16_9ACTN|nr:acyl-CoA dehydrogenase family protein [Actinomadura bangladeshensis]TDC20372.1 acyl-CoA dehydrogenase [Actinomadura bangladeshensis]
MDFSLSEEQQFLSSSTRSLAGDVFGESVARQVLDGDRARADKGWSHLREAGLTTLLVPEEYGGGGGSLLDACVVTTELFSALAPVPYLTSAVAAPLLLRAGPAKASGALLAELTEGTTCGLFVGADLAWPPEAPAAVCLDWASGRSGLVLGPDTAELVTAEPGPGVDPLHPLGARGDLDVSWSGTDLPEPARRALAGIRVAAASALTGCLAGAAQLAWDYIATREQYGKPIAAFQAVRHMAADLLVDLETCRSVSLGAAWQVENEPVEDAERIAAVAKSWCGEAAVRSIETSVQLLGGIGVTWESTAHLYLRTAHQLAASFGDTRSLLRRTGADFIAARGGHGDGSS